MKQENVDDWRGMRWKSIKRILLNLLSTQIVTTYYFSVVPKNAKIYFNCININCATEDFDKQHPFPFFSHMLPYPMLSSLVMLVENVSI